MPDKKDTDLWGKISDAATQAGKAIGDEFQKGKLDLELWNVNRDLQKALAKLGDIIYAQDWPERFSPDPEIGPLFDEIKDLKAKVAGLVEKRRAYAATSKPPAEDEVIIEPEPAKEAAGRVEAPLEQAHEKPTDVASMEFLEDDDTQFSDTTSQT